MSQWELVEVATEPEWELDASGLYVVINRVVEKDIHKGISGTRVFVRLDLMSNGDDTASILVRSWVGRADAVRKTFARWYDRSMYRGLSTEHIAYIGSELTRAELCEQYTQK